MGRKTSSGIQNTPPVLLRVKPAINVLKYLELVGDIAYEFILKRAAVALLGWTKDLAT